MKWWLAVLSIVGPLGWIAAVLLPTRPATGGVPFIECGSGSRGRPGLVVVQLLDAENIGHWSMQLEAGPLPPSSLEMGGPGTIRIELRGPPGPHSCEATPPSPFHVRALAVRLAGSTLRVLAQGPVPVEVQDRFGKALAKRIADPAQGARATLGW